MDARYSGPASSGASTISTPGFWGPLEDFDKPNIPYISGFTTKIYKQVAPSASKQSRSELSQSQLEAMTRSKAVVSSSPEYIEPSSTGQEAAQLTITAPIVTGAAPRLSSCRCHDRPQWSGVAVTNHSKPLPRSTTRYIRVPGRTSATTLETVFQMQRMITTRRLRHTNIWLQFRRLDFLLQSTMVLGC